MKQLVYFLMFGLVFTVLQVATVSADPVLTIGDPACATVPPAAGCPAGSGGNDDVALTIGDPRCAVGLAPDARDPGCPNYRAEGKDATAGDDASAHKVGQERWDPAMGGKGTPTFDAEKSCANEDTPALVAACVAKKTAAGN